MPLGLAPMFISFELGLSMFLGYVAADFIAGKNTGDQGRVRNMVFHIRSYRVHLHHWLLFLFLLLGIYFFNIFLFSPKIFYGFLGGVAVQGVLDYSDWTKIIKKL